MTTNYRTFCRQLIEVLEQYAPLHLDDWKCVSRVQAAIDSETLLEAVNMDKELYNPLRLNGYTSLEQVLEADPKDLMECKGLGPDRVVRILAAIRKYRGTPNLVETRRSLGDAPQPIPMSERLPGPGDCDAEGRCWWWHPSHPESGYSEGWMLRPRAWGAGRYDFDDRLMHTHWLPAHALPVPADD